LLLVFDADERAPGDDLKIVFEAVSRFDPDDKALVKKCCKASSCSTRPARSPKPRSPSERRKESA
jgi:hypothetical protein